MNLGAESSRKGHPGPARALAATCFLVSENHAGPVRALGAYIGFENSCPGLRAHHQTVSTVTGNIHGCEMELNGIDINVDVDMHYDKQTCEKQQGCSID